MTTNSNGEKEIHFENCIFLEDLAQRAKLVADEYECDINEDVTPGMMERAKRLIQTIPELTEYIEEMKVVREHSYLALQSYMTAVGEDNCNYCSDKTSCEDCCYFVIRKARNEIKNILGSAK